MAKLLKSNGQPYTAREIHSACGAIGSEWGSIPGYGDSGLSHRIPDTPFIRYVQSLGSLGSSTFNRSLNPVANSPWLYGAAMAVSSMLAQAPLTVFRETRGQVEKRRQSAITQGRGIGGTEMWAPPRGMRRRAQERHTRTLSRRAKARKITEEDVDHPFVGLLSRPNPIQDANQLIQTTIIGLISGEAFWSFLDSEGRPTTPSVGLSREAGDEIWPIPSSCVKPRFSPVTGGIFSGWDIRPPAWHPWYAIRNKGVIKVGIDGLIQFKLAGPEDPIRGFSPHNAAAGAIQSYEQIRRSNRALLKNDSTPRGVVYTTEGVDNDQKEELEEAWEEEYGGEGNVGKTAFLSKAKYERIGLSPKEMDYAKLLEVDRREILATVRTPESSLGISAATNYANQLGQDYGFLTRTVLPLARTIECQIDRWMFQDDGDNVYPAFDVSEVEALRAGLADKVRDAKTLAGSELHMPPRQAFEVVGLDAPGYDGDEVAFVGQALITAEDAADGLGGSLSAPADPVKTPESGDDDGESEPSDNTKNEEAAKEKEKKKPSKNSLLLVPAPAIHLQKTKAQKVKRQLGFVAVQSVVEKRLAKAYRKWARASRVETLANFDEQAKTVSQSRSAIVTQAFTIEDLLPLIETLEASLRISARPALSDALDQIFSFSEEDLGVVTFDIGLEIFSNLFSGYERRLVEETPLALIRNLRNSITEGFEAGETIPELRHRIAHVYDISVSSHKTLLVARTTSGGLLNGIRYAMFVEAGIEELEWLSADDEGVRHDHALFETLGASKIDTNYQDFAEVVTGGTLHYPGDFRAPFGQIANCRCTQIPS